MDRRPTVALVAFALLVVPVASGLSAGAGTLPGVGSGPGGSADAGRPTGPAGAATDRPAGPADRPTDDRTEREARAAESEAGTPRLSPPNGSPNRLSVGPGTVVGGYAVPGADLGGALSSGDAEFRAVYVAYLARERLETAETETQRRAVIRATLNRTETLIERLRTREAAAIRAYHRGSITEAELLQRLATIHAEAATLQAVLRDLKNRTTGVISNSQERRRTSLQRGLDGFTTPVRAAAGRAVRGETDGNRVHVAATTNGLVIETIDGELYVREAIRLDNYAPNATPRFGLTDTIERLQELYPWVFGGPADAIMAIDDRLFTITKSHAQGELLVYFDRTTGEAYREFQQLRLARLPTSPVATAEEGGLRLLVNHTDGGNPLKIRVVGAASGDPVDATVTVAGRSVGPTGSDGVVWALGARDPFEVSATAGGETVNVTVRP